MKISKEVFIRDQRLLLRQYIGQNHTILFTYEFAFYTNYQDNPRLHFKTAIKFMVKRVLAMSANGISISLKIKLGFRTSYSNSISSDCEGVKEQLTFLSQISFMASVTARETTYCTRGTTLPSSICNVKEKRRPPLGDSHLFFVRPVQFTSFTPLTWVLCFFYFYFHKDAFTVT
ncbi:hypothetical protein TorRG33x02_233230 [Trema orientale]|uniref:Uncharacterized protein n=1 Tax=Trema orientale TaxID=63057 RepID=A0A2P5E5K0_TREOI|nr:hypothetical protein TorRG33x02_233230 [Trema orientale]